MGDSAGLVLGTDTRVAPTRHPAPSGENERRRWAAVVAAGTVRCRVCHGLIDPAAPWNFGQQSESGQTPEHRRCNGLTGRRTTPAA